MSRLPSLAAPHEPHSYFNWTPYTCSHAEPWTSENGTPSKCPRTSDSHPGGQQLPSLRTLLQPQLLDSKPPAPSPPLDARRLPDPSRGYAAASPTLKRRFETDYYGDDRNGDAGSTRAPPVLHASLPYPTAQNANPPRNPAFLGHSRQNLSDPLQQMQRPPSDASGFSLSPASVTPASMPPLADDSCGPTAVPLRRRYDPAPRAPTRSSRCVGQREVPGEGMCYVYEDGSFCRVVIDGEPVNPSWGITKAGKPRKRLAQACLTCREKKIKCEPAVPKCHQCTKSQRVCRGQVPSFRLSSHRHRSNKVSRGLSQSGNQDEQSPSSNSSSLQLSTSEHLSPLSTRTNPPWEGPLSGQPPLKAPRIYEGNNSSASISNLRKISRSDTATTEGSPASRLTDSTQKRHLSECTISSGQSLTMEDPLDSNWEQDPYDADPQLTASLLHLYFTHAGRATYCIFPRQQFTCWVETCRDKSPDERMLLYALLAMGSVFASEVGQRSVGKLFSEIATHAVRKRFGRFSLQLCQTRLMLALFYFARGKAAEAWDFCGAGLRAISALRFNTEDGVKDFPDDDLHFGFDRPTLEECRRRTFWSGFLMDRYNGFCGGTLCFIHPEDTFLRLPCLERDYGSPCPREAPLFDVTLLHKPQPDTPLGTMAHLTLISAIWGEVLIYTSRAIHRPDQSYSQPYEEFYGLTCERLDRWREKLPSYLHFTTSNLDDSIAAGYAGTFMSMHALYHATQMRLNRHARTATFSASTLRRNIFRAHLSATTFINIMQALAPARRKDRLPNLSPHFVFSTPFSGYALMLAVDIVSAGGAILTLPDLTQSISTSLPAVTELAEFWASAKAQHKAISSRLKQLADIALSEHEEKKAGPYWRLTSSLETSFEKQDDLVYGVDDHIFFELVNGEAYCKEKELPRH